MVSKRGASDMESDGADWLHALANCPVTDRSPADFLAGRADLQTPRTVELLHDEVRRML